MLLCLIIGSCEGFTLFVLSKYAEQHEQRSYAQLVQAPLGHSLSVVLAVVLVVHTFGESGYRDSGFGLYVYIAVWDGCYLLICSGVRFGCVYGGSGLGPRFPMGPATVLY